MTVEEGVGGGTGSDARIIAPTKWGTGTAILGPWNRYVVVGSMAIGLIVARSVDSASSGVEAGVAAFLAVNALLLALALRIGVVIDIPSGRLRVKNVLKSRTISAENVERIGVASAATGLGSRTGFSRMKCFVVVCRDGSRVKILASVANRGDSTIGDRLRQFSQSHGIFLDS